MSPDAVLASRGMTCGHALRRRPDATTARRDDTDLSMPLARARDPPRLRRRATGRPLEPAGQGTRWQPYADRFDPTGGHPRARPTRRTSGPCAGSTPSAEAARRCSPGRRAAPGRRPRPARGSDPARAAPARRGRRAARRRRVGPVRHRDRPRPAGRAARGVAGGLDGGTRAPTAARAAQRSPGPWPGQRPLHRTAAAMRTCRTAWRCAARRRRTAGSWSARWSALRDRRRAGARRAAGLPELLRSATPSCCGPVRALGAGAGPALAARRSARREFYRRR